MANASSKVRELFRNKSENLTLAEIRTNLPDLKSNEISMALCYLRKARYLTREAVKAETAIGRKTIWSYTFHADRIPKEQV